MPARPKLLAREPEWRDHLALTLTRSHWSMAVAPEAEVADPVVRQIAALALQTCASVLEVVPPVKRTALRLKHPRRGEFRVGHGERDGPHVTIAVTPESLERALLLADQLLLLRRNARMEFHRIIIVRQGGNPDTPGVGRPANSGASGAEAAARGTAPYLKRRSRHPHRGAISRRTQSPQRRRARARETRVGYHAARTTSIATGKLRVGRQDYTYGRYRGPARRSWYDRKGSLVEDQIQEILLGCYEVALYMRQRRMKDEEQARQRAEEERLREERLARQEGNAALIFQLETDA